MMNDTTHEIAVMVRKMLLSRGGAERLIMGSQMFETARIMILASLPPDLSPNEVKCRLCDRLYGNEIDLAAFSKRLEM